MITIDKKILTFLLLCAFTGISAQKKSSILVGKEKANDTLFLSNKSLRFFKILRGYEKEISYNDYPENKMEYQMLRTSFDSLKYDHLNTFKKFYFEASIGLFWGQYYDFVGGLNGALSIGYQFNKLLGIGISSIGVIAADNSYNYFNSLTADYKLDFSEKSIILHLGQVTGRTALVDEYCTVKVNTTKFNPAIGLSFKHYFKRFAVFDLSFYYQQSKTKGTCYDISTRKPFPVSGSINIFSGGFQVGFYLPKRYKKVQVF